MPSRRGSLGSGSCIAHLTCPVTVWHGEHDGFAPLQDLLDFLGDRATSVEVVPDAGHLLALRRWDGILRHAAMDFAAA